MLVSKSIVFIHLTKCAGTFVKRALADIDGPIVYRGRFHGCWDEVPDLYKNMPVITTVRNPFDWWVSWYHFMSEKGWFNPIALAAVSDGHISFSEMMFFISQSLILGSRQARLVDEMIEKQLKLKSSLVNDLNYDMIHKMRCHKMGILSWRFDHQLEGLHKKNIFFVKQENLINDLIASMVWAGKKLSEKNETYLKGLSKVNASTIRDVKYQHYYSSELTKEIVAKLDKKIIDRFGYKF